MGNRGEGKKAVFDCLLKLFAQGDILCQRYFFKKFEAWSEMLAEGRVSSWGSIKQIFYKVEVA